MIFRDKAEITSLHRRQCYTGKVGSIMQHVKKIEAFEQRHAADMP